MLAQPLEDSDLAGLDPRDYLAEWKWDGIRVQLVARGPERRLYSRSGDDIGAAFPESLEAMPAEVTLDGELLVLRDGEVASFNDLQQRLNRKTPNPKLLRDFPAACGSTTFCARRQGSARPLLRRAPASARSMVCARAASDARSVAASAVHQLGRAARIARQGARERGIEGLMLKRADSLYVSGRPKGPWFKWKRGALTLDTVLMYAQRGHGKRSSFYSDYTFGAWRGE